jgi:CheY-like chemotaxis protein
MNGVNPRPITALIADDVLASRELLRQMLGKLGVVVVAQVADGHQALARLATHAVDVVFLDIDMPGCNGLEVLKQMQSRQPMPWVVMVSAHSTMDNLQVAIDHGAKGFVVKPYAMAKIQQAIERFQQAAQ